MSKVKTQRPVNLNLLTLRFPMIAIVSILHRLSGVMLFVLMPLVFYLFSLSTHSRDSFNSAGAMMHCIYVKSAVWLFSAALAYHLFAGIRHTLADIGLGEELQPARWSAYAVLALSLVAIIISGILIW